MHNRPVRPSLAAGNISVAIPKWVNRHIQFVGNKSNGIEIRIRSFRRASREPKRLIDALFLWGWRGDDDSLWKNLEGFDRRHTPLSDHICSILEVWTAETLGFVSDFEMLFEKFEMLAAMKHVERSTTEEIELAQADTDRGFRAVRVPTGRIGWDNDRRMRLERELDAGSALRKKLISTGYARDDRFIDLFIVNQQRLSSRFGF